MASSGASQEKGADTHTGCANPWAAVTLTRDMPAPRGTRWRRQAPSSHPAAPWAPPLAMRLKPCGRDEGQEDALGRGVPGRSGAQRGRAAGGGGPFKCGGGGTMAIITLALEVTPGPLRFHLGRGRGDGPLPGGGGEGGSRRGEEGRGGPARLGPARRPTRPPAAGGHCGAGTGAAAAPRRFLPPPLKVRGGPGCGLGVT